MLGGKRIASVNLHTTSGEWKGNTGTGQAPTLQYAAEKDMAVLPAAVAPRGGASSTPEADAEAVARQAELAAAQDAAVAGIVAARARIPARRMGPSPNNNAGWDYNPDKDPDAAGYRSWVQTALPKGVKATDWEWQVFKKIQPLEGQTGRFTTYDRTLSVGAGFSTAGGQTQAIIGKTFDLLPEVKALAYAAGLIVSASGGMAVVNTDKKWILRDQDADAYIQVQTQLLSLLVDVSQGALPTGTGPPDEQAIQRQTFLDVQWQQFLAGTLAGVTPRVRAGPSTAPCSRRTRSTPSPRTSRTPSGRPIRPPIWRRWSRPSTPRPRKAPGTSAPACTGSSRIPDQPRSISGWRVT